MPYPTDRISDSVRGNMEHLRVLDLWLIAELQRLLKPTAGGFWTYVSYLGEESFYMLVIPALYWSVSKSHGVRLLLFLLCSSFTNDIAKMMLFQPRPYWVSADIQGLYAETSFGSPSGHSQNGVGVWVYLALLLKDYIPFKYSGSAALFLGLLISFSRVVLGVHFVTDLVVGWLMAGVLLWVFTGPIEKRFSAWSNTHEQRSAWLGIISAVISAVIGLIVISVTSRVNLPESWVETAHRAHQAIGKQDVVLSPFSSKIILSIAGTLLGSAVGWLLMKRFSPFAETGTMKHKLGRYVLGTVGLFIFQIGLAAVLPKAGQSGYEVMRTARYVLIGVWVVFGAPYLFVRAGLCQRSADSTLDS